MAVDQIKRLYESMPAKLDRARKRFGRALTLSEKILVAHADDFDKQEWSRGKAQLRLRVDRVSLQDATGQMALLQFMQAGKKQAAVPSTVHCDHLIRAQSGASEDTKRAITENNEVYDFLHSASRKYGIGFWKPGAGIIHQVVLENYAFPGGLMIGADSHTPNCGGLGMVAIGVGGADCGEAMAGLAWEVLDPGLIGVRLTGKLAGWTSAKDVITHLLGLLTVKGGTNKIVEYFGPGASSISATGKGTICNMGAELGATTSLFHFDDRMSTYLAATDRADIAKLAEQYREHLVSDPEVLADPKKYYDEIVEIDLSERFPALRIIRLLERGLNAVEEAVDILQGRIPRHPLHGLWLGLRLFRAAHVLEETGAMALGHERRFEDHEAFAQVDVGADRLDGRQGSPFAPTAA